MFFNWCVCVIIILFSLLPLNYAGANASMNVRTDTSNQIELQFFSFICSTSTETRFEICTFCFLKNGFQRKCKSIVYQVARALIGVHWHVTICNRINMDERRTLFCMKRILWKEDTFTIYVVVGTAAISDWEWPKWSFCSLSACRMCSVHNDATRDENCSHTQFSYWQVCWCNARCNKVCVSVCVLC